ncbi:MAG: lipoate--protein ligase family protein [Pirellulaceae bacterium]|nr:lipoate--protein ligase family protein [Pirellulaceae bacterium]
MHILDLTRDDPRDNLALDEALLDEAEQRDPRCELLRTWEFRQPIVVLGRSSRLVDETHAMACHRDEIPILRRCSGGAAIVAGPGCFMYSLVLSYELRPQLRMIDQAHQFVLGRIIAALQSLDVTAELAGTSDLSWQNRKFSGNSLRSKRTHLLYHGTLLYDFSLPLVSKYLASPPRQPEYRQGRTHDGFLANVPVSRDALQTALYAAWQPATTCNSWPEQRTQELVANKYSQDDWNGRF